MLFAGTLCVCVLRLLGTAPLTAVPNIVGSNKILSSGKTVMGSFVLKVLIVDEQSIKPIEVGASAWSTSTEFGSTNGLDKEKGVL